ncbi:hypothetical protein FJ434_20790 [Mesorhizobium sp. B2-5-13]|uniref:ribbon-helix-helix domain-containing protein n=1 Tax=unclassified Mesorhizobium TaxID=325217 RepID=UPI00112D5FB2|nr:MULTISPECIES: ribbon-helix-helix domain-containing protein [unclassified Mesorhizobium]TPJ81932.1 hypothetical protein FJ434_20790 [Mesorhizobium sp. B2-5-13]TPK45869.1 hypothetical protein FJ560_20005 [Mesorhizobium sp. B2-5-5]
MDDRITVRMTPEMLARVDAWIAEQSEYVSRQEAVRRCINLAFSHGGPPSAAALRAEAETRDEPPNDNVVVYVD